MVAKQTETAMRTMEKSRYRPSRGSVNDVAGITSITKQLLFSENHGEELEVSLRREIVNVVSGIT